MSSKKTLILPLVAMTACFSAPAGAEDVTVERVHEKYVIAVKTDDFELSETDVSALAVGESKTITTDDGKTIDVLKTEKGIELYVDGVLQDIDFGDGLDAENSGWHKEIEIICTEADTCDEMVWISADAETNPEHIAGDGEMHVIKRRIHVECTDEATCEEHAHGDAGEHREKVIVIRKKAEHD